MPRNLKASARTYPQTLLRLPDMLVIQWIAKENKIMVYRIYHNKLANDKTHMKSSCFPCDEQKCSKTRTENDISSMSLYTYYNIKMFRFVLLIPEILWPSKPKVRYLSKFVKSSLSLEESVNVSILSFKQFDESNRHNKYYWPNSKYNQISRM